MKPIKIIYDETGNTLYVQFSDKKEAYCTEINGGRDIILSKTKDGSAIGFEILNYLPKDTKMGLDRLPIASKIIRALAWTWPGAEILSVQESHIPGAAVPDETSADGGTLGAPAVVTPTEEATEKKSAPYFRTIIAIAGLLAVAYLVLRPRDWAHELCEGGGPPFQFSFFQKYGE